MKIQVSRFADYSNSDYRNEVTACLFYGILKIQVFTFADIFGVFETLPSKTAFSV